MQHTAENTQADPKESVTAASSGKDQEKPTRSRIGRFDKLYVTILLRYLAFTDRARY